MSRHSSLLIFLGLLFGLGASATPTTSDDSTLARQRGQFPPVWELAKHDPSGSWKQLATGLESYPLYPYLDLAWMQQRMAQLTRAEADAFLKAWPDSLPAAILRDAFLLELARREDWQNYLALYDAGTHSRELRCDALQARLALGERLDFGKDVEALWLSASALPAACDAVTRWAQEQGKLTDALVWQRIELASAKAYNADLITRLALLLDGAERETAEHTALALRDPSAALDRAARWPDAARSREAITLAIERRSRRDADDADARWTQLRSRFHFDAGQRGRALRAIALYSAASYAPDALARLTALPADMTDTATREWRVRAALAAGDFKATLAALDGMPEAQRGETRWRYLRARVLSKLGRGDAADAQFRALAGEANFYGFLAADQIGAAYTICGADLSEDNAAEAALRKDRNLARAFEFFAIDRPAEARREWDFAMQDLSFGQRRQAIVMAARAGWIDRAVYGFNQGDDLRLYTLRFPLARRDEVVRDAHDGGVDPAWAYAIIRAESAWTSDAKSGANAYGLMQLLPATAARLAREQQLAYSGTADLLDPEINIQLGTRYLGQMAARYDGSPWLASAAYNAGPDPVSRWVDARDSLDPDFFIETIPYRETREYVARVLAFSVIYDWRLHGAVQTLSSRLPRIGQAYDPPGDNVMRRAVACPAAKTNVATN